MSVKPGDLSGKALAIAASLGSTLIRRSPHPLPKLLGPTKRRIITGNERRSPKRRVNWPDALLPDERLALCSVLSTQSISAKGTRVQTWERRNVARLRTAPVKADRSKFSEYEEFALRGADSPTRIGEFQRELHQVVKVYSRSWEERARSSLELHDSE